MKYILSIAMILIISSCGSNEFSCLCIDNGDNGKEVGNHIIKTDTRQSAAFECRQKNMQYPVGEFYKDVRCELKIEEEK